MCGEAVSPGPGRRRAPVRGHQGYPTSMRAGHDLDPPPVGVEEVGGEVARAVGVARPGGPVVGAAVGESRLVGRVDGRAPRGGDGDVPEAGSKVPAAGDDPEARLVDPVGDRARRVDDAPAPERVEDGVVERRRAREVGDLVADVVDHAPERARSPRSTSRWVTSMKTSSLSRYRSAKCSAIATERWRPPVQPMAIVR